MTVHAEVKMTVLVMVGDSWGDKVQFDQVERQASESAIGDLRNAAAKTRGRITIVGKPTVMAIKYTAAQVDEWDLQRRAEHYAPKPAAPAKRKWPRIRPLVAWYDLWIGAYWDRKARALYVLPLPCLGFVLEFGE